MADWTRLCPGQFAELDEREEAMAERFAAESALRLDREIADQLQLISESLNGAVPTNLTQAALNWYRAKADAWVTDLGLAAGHKTYKQLSALYVKLGAQPAQGGAAVVDGGGGGRGGGYACSAGNGKSGNPDNAYDAD